MPRNDNADGLRRRTLSDPQRHVPASVRLKLLLGGGWNRTGWFLLGFGLILVWVFGGTNVLRDVAFFSGGLGVAEGQVASVTRTRVSINEKRVYEYHYTYSVDGISYEGATKGFGGKYRAKSNAAVEYVLKNHARSRIRNLSTGKIGVLFVAALPLIGVGLMGFGIVKGLRGLRLLRYGKLTNGVLISREATNTSINKRTVYKYTFAFKNDDQQSCEVSAKTHLSGRFSGEHIDGVEQTQSANIEEPLLYDPHNPEEALLLDDLPGAPRIDSRGQIPGSMSSLVPSLILPAVIIGGHAYWILKVLEAV